MFNLTTFSLSQIQTIFNIHFEKIYIDPLTISLSHPNKYCSASEIIAAYNATHDIVFERFRMCQYFTMEPTNNATLENIKHYLYAVALHLGSSNSKIAFAHEYTQITDDHVRVCDFCQNIIRAMAQFMLLYLDYEHTPGQENLDALFSTCFEK